MSVTDVRSVLPFVLTRLKCAGRDAIPVVIGRHREPMGVLISIEQFHEYCALVCELLAGESEEDRPGDDRPPRIGA